MKILILKIIFQDIILFPKPICRLLWVKAPPKQMWKESARHQECNPKKSERLQRRSEILQVLRIDLTLQDEEFTNLPFHIKLLLDNLQAAFTLRQKPLFQKTLKAFELHLVSTRNSLKHLVVNSLARRMEIQAPQRKLSYENKLFKTPP